MSKKLNYEIERFVDFDKMVEPTLRHGDSFDATSVHARSAIVHFRSAYCRWSMPLICQMELQRNSMKLTDGHVEESEIWLWCGRVCVVLQLLLFVLHSVGRRRAAFKAIKCAHKCNWVWLHTVDTPLMLCLFLFVSHATAKWETPRLCRQSLELYELQQCTEERERERNEKW